MSEATAIEALASLGVFEGTECDDGFCPDEPVRRWVAAVWLARVLGLDPGGSDSMRFADVLASAWWAGHVGALAGEGATRACATNPE